MKLWSEVETKPNKYRHLCQYDNNTHKVTDTPLTFEHRADLPDSQTPQAGKLTEGQLEEEKRNATENQHDKVGKHEGTCSRENIGKQVNHVLHSRNIILLYYVL